MAINYIAGGQRNVLLTVGAGIKAGTAVAVGEITGTVETDADSDNKAVVNIKKEATYKHSVRNVLTYSGGAEATWGGISEGDEIYLDGSGTMPTGVTLSTSPKDDAGADNAVFGKALSEDATATVKTATIEVVQDNTLTK